MKVKCMAILTTVILLSILLSGCIENTTYIGVLKDYHFNQNSWGNPGSVAFLFEDGQTITITRNYNEYTLDALLLIARNNIGKTIKITYMPENGNAVTNLEIWS